MKTLTVTFKSKDDTRQSCNDHTLYYFYLYMLRKTYQIFFYDGLFCYFFFSSFVVQSPITGKWNPLFKTGPHLQLLQLFEPTVMEEKPTGGKS